MADRATIDDVAKRAGVSIKTVSRVVNREPNVAKATQARVEKAIAALDYRPSPSARNLASQRSNVIGLLYDNFSGSYVLGVQSGVIEACRQHGYQLLIHPCVAASPGVVEEIVELARQSRLEGLVLTPPLSDLRPLLRALDAARINYVCMTPGQRMPPRRAIYSNDREICEQMTRHLVDLGHRRIGFIAGHRSHGAVANRFHGYRDGLAAAALRYDESLVAHGDNSFDSGLTCGRTLLSRRDPPTAIFASNDDMAAGALVVAHEFGLTVPGDLSIAGFDDSPLARQTWPPLTTVRQPIAEMALRATEMLLERLNDTATHGQDADRFDSTLILRQSTARPRAAQRRPGRRRLVASQGA